MTNMIEQTETLLMLKELFIFGIGAGKDGQNTLKFENVMKFNQMEDRLTFEYTSVSTGKKRQAVFFKSNISGWSGTGYPSTSQK